MENINILNSDENIDVIDFSNKLESNQILLDVRPELEYQMCHLPNSLNIPYTTIQKCKDLNTLETVITEKCNNEGSCGNK